VHATSGSGARPDFAAIGSELEVIQAPIARLPTGGDLAKAALGIIFGAAALVILFDICKSTNIGRIRALRSEPAELVRLWGAVL
jgi:hypothetical protein